MLYKMLDDLWRPVPKYIIEDKFLDIAIKDQDIP